MTKEFETTISGSDGDIDGIVTPKNNDGTAWDFKSIDGTVHLVLIKNEDGSWERAGGTEPYFSSWTEELGRKISKQE